MKPIALLIVFLLSAVAFAGETVSETEQEIAHLFNYLKGSTCEFYRNGTWYSPSDAAEHTKIKYSWLKDKGLIDTTEEFIDRAASKISMSGNPYMVRCSTSDKPVKSSIWFNKELERFRNKK